MISPPKRNLATLSCIVSCNRYKMKPSMKKNGSHRPISRISLLNYAVHNYTQTQPLEAMVTLYVCLYHSTTVAYMPWQAQCFRRPRGGPYRSFPTFLVSISPRISWHLYLSIYTHPWHCKLFSVRYVRNKYHHGIGGVLSPINYNKQEKE